MAMFRGGKFGVAQFAVVIVCAAQVLSAQSAFLNFTENPKLMRCDIGAKRPCFRMQFNFVRPDGRPSPVTLPKTEKLRSSLEVLIDGEQARPFFVAADQGQTKRSVQQRVALILIDVSGSMLVDVGGKNRFAAAKEAVAEYLKEFEDNADRVAIVPFGSRHVIQTVEEASFVQTRAEAQKQLDALSPPERSNNTALYSATKAGLDRLLRERRVLSGSSETLMIVLTDGKNEVYENRGDDAGLLKDEQGLAVASEAVRKSDVIVQLVGMGDRKSIDESAMARLGTRPPLITDDMERVRQVFRIPRVSQNNQMTATIEAPERYASRGLLAGRLLHFRATLRLENGDTLTQREEALWAAPPVATPPYQADCSEQEKSALFAGFSGGDQSMWATLRPVIVSLSMAGLIALLWFALPRFVWPESYGGAQEIAIRPDNWSGPRHSDSSRPARPVGIPGRKPPTGFDHTGAGGKAAGRVPSDPTIVQSPKSRLS